jgi:hypothetical protein
MPCFLANIPCYSSTKGQNHIELDVRNTHSNTLFFAINTKNRQL